MLGTKCKSSAPIDVQSEVSHASVKRGAAKGSASAAPTRKNAMQRGRRQSDATQCDRQTIDRPARVEFRSAAPQTALSPQGRRARACRKQTRTGFSARSRRARQNAPTMGTNQGAGAPELNLLPAFHRLGAYRCASVRVLLAPPRGWFRPTRQCRQRHHQIAPASRMLFRANSSPRKSRARTPGS
jgi:hypothetical protein